MMTLDGARIGIAAQAVGIARGALEEGLAFARQRKGLRAQHLGIPGHPVHASDMATSIEAARLLVTGPPG
jgi:alkylation response protein AidB-like acyl-CoA dehydrogenase